MIDSSNKYYNPLLFLLLFFLISGNRSNAQICDSHARNQPIIYYLEHGTYEITFSPEEKYMTWSQLYLSLLEIEAPLQYSHKFVLCNTEPILIWLYYGSRKNSESRKIAAPWFNLHSFFHGITPYHCIHNKSFLLETSDVDNYKVSSYLKFYKNNKVIKYDYIFQYTYPEFLFLMDVGGLSIDHEYLIELRYEIVKTDNNHVSATYTDNIVFLRPFKYLDQESIFRWVESMSEKLGIELY